MTSFPRTARMNDLIRVELSDLIRRKVKDPRVASVSVTAVSTTADFSQARVSIALLDDARGPEALKGLAHAAGFLRSELGRRLQVKRVPELLFEVDHSARDEARMDELWNLLEREGRS
ncbi:MAG TPA: 30S ribosome-binding factor RbfA [Nitrospiria bacterium]|nr:30S ribosome-binding factor RbfA [Nitrospiria bacterium]